MKKLIIVLFVLSFSGCATIGKIMQGTGDAIVSGGQNRQPNTTKNCEGTTYAGRTTLQCR